MALSMLRTLLLPALLATILSCATRAHAIEVTPAKAGQTECDFLLSGEIRKGDLSLLQHVMKDREKHDIPVLCLDSTGGDFDEALRISSFILERGAGTRLLRSSRCLSACSIIFMSGNMPTFSGKGTLISRVMHKGAELGFHAPYIEVEKGVYDQGTVSIAYDAAMRVISAFLRLSEEMQFDKSLIATMLAQGPEHAFRITTVDDVGRWNIELTGYQHAPDRMITDAMLQRACDNNYAWWGKDRVIISRGSRQGPVANSAIPAAIDLAGRSAVGPRDRTKTLYKVVASEHIPYAGGKDWSHTDYYEPAFGLFSMGYGPEGALECSISIASRSSRARGVHDMAVGFRYEGEKIEWLVRQTAFPWQFEDPRTKLVDLPEGTAGVID